MNDAFDERIRPYKPCNNFLFHLLLVGTGDGVVKTSIYCVVCLVAIRGHTTCIVKTRHRTLLLGV